MPKKKVAKSKPQKSSSMLAEHKNLKWLLPLLILSVFAFAFAIKHRASDVDKGGDRSAIIKTEIKEKLQLNDSEEEEAQPTTTPTSYPSF